MHEAEFEGAAGGQSKIVGLEKWVGWRDATRADAGDGTEESIHCGVDRARAVASPALRRYRKIGYEPTRTRARGGSERCNNEGEFVGREAVEEERRGERVEGGELRLKPRKGGGLKMEAGGIWDGAGVGLSVGEHADARVDADDFEVGKAKRGGAKEMAVADARDEETFAVRERVEVGDASALETRAGENAFKPGVVRSEKVERHGGAVGQFRGIA